ncbi:MAG: PEGA domain-containing protein [Prevotella sp.]|nr:PEGA domain-containing protein [Prevotella sp.]
MKRRFSFLLRLLFLLLPLCAEAQTAKPKFSVVSFREDPRATAANQPPYRQFDEDGNPFAIVKVRSTNPDDDLRVFSFDFGMLDHRVVESVDDELWLYVQQNAKTVTINRSGYQQLTNYDLRTTIRGGHTYELMLQLSAAPVYQQILQFNIQPISSRATVMITPQGGRQEKLGDADANGQLAKSLPLGSYTYQVMAENYHTSEGIVTLKEANKTHVEIITLKANFATVTLSVDVDADIYVNGEMKGRRQWNGDLRAGQYTVECRQECHKAVTQTITVVENQPQTYRLTPPTPITGILQVTTQPLGARVVVDGQERGTTPLTVESLIIGSHRLELHLKNHKSESLTFDIKEQTVTPVDIALSDMARMTIKSQPAGAELTIDGQRLGQTPYTADMVSGDYDILLVKNGWHDFARHIHLDSSHPEVTLHMDKQYQKPFCFYLQTGFQAGSLMGAEGTIGAYISNVNIEAGYTLGLAKSEDIYWNYTSGDAQRPRLCQYKPTVITLRAGYGIVMGTRLRLTPQAGASLLQLSATDSKSSAVSATAGIRADYAIASGIGIFATPEAAFPVQKGDNYKLLEPLSSKIKGWATGFNLRAGLTIFF